MTISSFGLSFLAFLVAVLVLRPTLRVLERSVPESSQGTTGFNAPVVGGVGLWIALAAGWLFRPAEITVPAIVLGLLALRLLASPGDRELRWTVAVMPLVDLIVCAALVQKLDGGAWDAWTWGAVLSGVAVLQGTFRLRNLDGLGILVLGIALAALASLTAGAAHWLAASGAGAAAGLLLLNLPLRANRRWRIQSGQGGAAVLALVFGTSALLAGTGKSGSLLGPIHLLWLLPLPCCELLRLLARRQPSHQLLLDAGFSVTALFLLYAVMSLVPAVALQLLPSLPEQTTLLGVFAALVATWFIVLWQAPRLMWMLPWRLRRIDVAHKD